MSGRVMAIGRVGAGKTTLLRALVDTSLPAHKTQMIEFHDCAVDTPGEYAEMPRFYQFLISTAMKAAAILVVHDAVAPRPTLPPGFCRIFRQPVVGAVTKVDLPDARPERAEDHLRLCGVTGPIYPVSAVTGEGIAELRASMAHILEGGTDSDFRGSGHGGDQGAGGRH